MAFFHNLRTDKTLTGNIDNSQQLIDLIVISPSTTHQQHINPHPVASNLIPVLLNPAQWN
jgi:hypothetical protein